MINKYSYTCLVFSSFAYFSFLSVLGITDIYQRTNWECPLSSICSNLDIRINLWARRKFLLDLISPTVCLLTFYSEQIKWDKSHSLIGNFLLPVLDYVDRLSAEIWLKSTFNHMLNIFLPKTLRTLRLAIKVGLRSCWPGLLWRQLPW